MPAIQRRLFPDPKPLVEEFGAEFFRELPERPGVYLMHDHSGAVLYIGKAKCLRRRLHSYRVANPERMPRRTLRLLRLVRRITWETCDNESGALRRESELLLQLKPRFNRAGVWRGTPRFLAWRVRDEALEFIIANRVDDGWLSAGPFGAHARYLRHALVRLFWCVLQSERGMFGMPVGWFDGYLPVRTVIPMSGFEDGERMSFQLHSLAQGATADFTTWLGPYLNARPAGERSLIENDLEYVINRLPRRMDVGVDSTASDGTAPMAPPIAGFPGTKLFAFCAGLSAQ